MYSGGGSKSKTKTGGRRTSSFTSTPPKKSGGRSTSSAGGSSSSGWKMNGKTTVGLPPPSRAGSGRMKTMGAALGGFRSMGAANKPKMTSNFVHAGGIKTIKHGK